MSGHSAAMRALEAADRREVSRARVADVQRRLAAVGLGDDPFALSAALIEFDRGGLTVGRVRARAAAMRRWHLAGNDNDDGSRR